jgi:hypothetical protein
MTEAQFRYLVKITRQRIGEEDSRLLQAVRSGQFESVSYRSGKAETFREVLFWLHGMASDMTEDAFK